jgi:mono/diheme cytochrome c family protein
MASRRLSICRGTALLALVLLGLGTLPGAAPGQTSIANAVPQRPLQAPADPIAAAAYVVLEKHCARCHQGGKLERPAPAAAFGNVLRLDELASSPHLVRPGNPDASPLYVMMLRRLMPADVDAGATPPGDNAAPPGPTPQETADVRSWIGSLPPRTQRCTDRRVVTPADHAATLSQLIELTREDPSKLRFVSIAHLHNGCAPPDALAAYRQAIVHLFNSLSWKVAPVAVPPIDVAQTLFKINLDDIGWLPEHWERLMRLGSDPLGLTPPLPADVRQAFSTTTPVARADWFTATVLRAPLYYDVLGLPGTGAEIVQSLQIAPVVQQPSGDALRTVVQTPYFSREPSLIELGASPTGAFWQAYHRLAGEAGAGFDAFLGNSPSKPVPHHMRRAIFTLPNGLPAFFILDQRGDRIDNLAANLTNPGAVGHTQVRSGLDCMACHSTGPTQARRSGDPSSPLTRARLADRETSRAALRRIGVDPDLTLDGVAPLVALSKEYSRPVDSDRAAAEIGVTIDDLRKLADDGDSATNSLARRLLQGLVPRHELDANARGLLAALGVARPATASEPEAKSAGEPSNAAADRGQGLVVYSDKTQYRRGDNLRLYVRTDTNCHLTVISIDTRGRGTAIYPNDFETNTLLGAGQELQLPAPDAAYTFRLNQPGRETIVALCSQTPGLIDGIRHDFEKQRFTDLGDYATFLAKNAWPEPAKVESVPGRPEPRQRARRRGAPEPASLAHVRPEQIIRTAITIIVE